MQKQISILLLVAVLAPWAVFLKPVEAQTVSPSQSAFNYNRIISDEDFTESVSMSAERIQAFLSTQPGPLKDYSTLDTDGVKKTAAQLIYEVSTQYKISPKVLLSVIQKESSLIKKTDFKAPCTVKTAQGTTWPCGGTKDYRIEWAFFYGWCEDESRCYFGSPALEEYRGFRVQVSSAARAFRRYIDQIADPLRGYTTSGWAPGKTKEVKDCMKWAYNINGDYICSKYQAYQVTPQNSATCALFTYTPHVASATSFYYWWNEFGFGTERVYPDGSLLRAKNSSRVYLIENGRKRPFVTLSAFISRYSFSKVITVNPDQLFLYETGTSIAYANYSLLQTPNGGVYLLVDDTVRPISSGAAFKAAGFSRDEVVKVKWADIGPYQVGEKITTQNIFPSGQLFQSKKTGAIYFVKDGLRYGIPSRDILKNQFKNRKAIPMTSEKLQAYPMNGNVVFKDGELITSKKGGTAYFMSNGQKLPIASWDVAVAYHFDKIWKNIIKTDQVSLDAIPTGPTLDIDGVVQTTATK